jgi:FdhE protein
MTAGVSDGTRRQLDALHKTHPEWRLLLSLWEQVFQEDGRDSWSNVTVTVDPARPPDAPLLAEARIGVSSLAVSTWLRRLLSQITTDYDNAPTLNSELANRLDPMGLLEAAITLDEHLIGLLANQAGVEPDPLAALANIVAAPVLRASARQIASQAPPGWSEGYCPICGAWATLAENRGLDRTRRLRCGRCGGDWQSTPMQCPFCKTLDFNQLSTLVPENSGESQKVETCRSCHGYLKSMTALRKWSSDEVVLADLSSVELDFVALDRGFSRPSAPAVTFDVAIDAIGP